jgi:hypothetical protein
MRLQRSSLALVVHLLVDMRCLCILSIALAGAACASDTLDEPIETEEIGVADYVLDNQSSRDLLIRFETAGDEGGQIFWAGPIAVGDRVVFASDSRVGALPNPSDTFAIFELADPEGPMLYTQDPIDNGLWAVETVSEDHVEIVLAISEI